MSKAAEKTFIIKDLEWHPFILGVKLEIKTVHAAWRDQAEKLAETLAKIRKENPGTTEFYDADEALAEFEKWKLET